MRTEEIKSAVIFQGMTDEELNTALKELRASEKKYKKGGVILRAGETTSCPEILRRTLFLPFSYNPQKNFSFVVITTYFPP